MGQPALVVAGTYLGAISHALTALTALRAHGVATAGLVVNETQGSDVTLEATVLALGGYVGDVAIHAMARDAPAPQTLVRSL
jgi:dethiobiotin synthetase